MRYLNISEPIRLPRDLEDAIGGEADALGLGELAVVRLGVELREEGSVLHPYGCEPAAEGSWRGSIRMPSRPPTPPPPLALT